MCLSMPGRILEILDAKNSTARVEVSGEVKTVSLALLAKDEQVAVGDYVLINVGFAMSRIDEREALETREMLEGFGREFEVAAEMHAGGSTAG